MGKCALESHIKGLKHLRNLNVQESNYGIRLLSVSKNKVNLRKLIEIIEF